MVFKKIMEAAKRGWQKIRESYQHLKYDSSLWDDEYENQWLPLSAEAQNISLQNLNLTAMEIRQISRYMVLTNPNYSGLVRIYMKYINGRGFSITATKKKNQKIWERFVKRVKFNKIFNKILFNFYQDGEVILYLPLMKFLDPDKIFDVNGDSLEKLNSSVLAFYYKTDEESAEVYYMDDILYISEELYDRGLPYLMPVMIDINDFKKWLRARKYLNEIRSSIALLRNMNASPTAVKNFADSKVTSKRSPVGRDYTSSLRRKIFEPGTIIDSSGIDYKFLEPNIDAQDVAADGRTIGLQKSSFTGLPEFMTTGDASNGNYSSAMVSEGPGEKEFEYWQLFFKEFLVELYHWVLSQEFVFDVDDPIITFPNIISRNAYEESQIYTNEYDRGIISPQEWQRKKGVDSERMKKENEEYGRTIRPNTASEEKFGPILNNNQGKLPEEVRNKRNLSDWKK